MTARCACCQEPTPPTPRRDYAAEARASWSLPARQGAAVRRILRREWEQEIADAGIPLRKRCGCWEACQHDRDDVPEWTP